MFKHGITNRPSSRLTSSPFQLDSTSISFDFNRSSHHIIKADSFNTSTIDQTHQVLESCTSPVTSPNHIKYDINLSTPAKCSNGNSKSAIKVYAQVLSQEVEYKTLQVTTQTKSSQIVRSLLKKFRLKHKDPNLFYLTLERWIRKDGLKSRNVILLRDDSCPLQLQHCCSSNPQNDIKFTLQMRPGALVKIYCSDVVQDVRYKCLSLSTQTTVEETIHLMIHCLNLTDNSLNHNENNTSLRITSSPISTLSTNSSSSGIESEPNNGRDLQCNKVLHSTNESTLLNVNSRTSSITSISTSSNISTLSTSITDQYCLIIECKDTNFRRVLDSSEYLVDVYYDLLAEAKGQTIDTIDSQPSETIDNFNFSPESRNSGDFKLLPNNQSLDLVRGNHDQWFLIKLVARDDLLTRQNFSMSAIKLPKPHKYNGTQIPTIPQSLIRQFNNSNNLKSFISTTQIEVKQGHCSSHSFNGSSNGHGQSHNSSEPYNITSPTSTNSPRFSEFDSKLPIIPPRVFPKSPEKRQRNMSTASSTFGPSTIMSPMNRLNNHDSRRRYDPARLAEDLSRLDVYGNEGQ